MSSALYFAPAPWWSPCLRRSVKSLASSALVMSVSSMMRQLSSGLDCSTHAPATTRQAHCQLTFRPQPDRVPDRPGSDVERDHRLWREGRAEPAQGAGRG